MSASSREPKAARRKQAKASGLPAAETADDITQLDMFDLLDDGL